MRDKCKNLPRIVRNTRRGKNHEQYMADGWIWHPTYKMWWNPGQSTRRGAKPSSEVQHLRRAVNRLFNNQPVTTAQKVN